MRKPGVSTSFPTRRWAAIAGFVGGLLLASAGYALRDAWARGRASRLGTELVELARPGHPLLKRLMLEAPGTFAHSILVGQLAEQASAAIGADPMLARVGGYFHDVGKLERPEFFCENADEGCDAHSGRSAESSADIIIAHVADGLRLAEDFRLPKAVRDVIRQHHGTTKVTYFYEKQRALGLDAVTRFRYRGERPASREAALVMLADSAEAAVRGIRSPGRAQVEAIVHAIAEQRVAEGQLEPSVIASADIEKACAVYARMLTGMAHERVAYPERTVSEREVHERQRLEPSRT